MRFLLDSAKKDLRRRLKDPVALALWLGIPLVIGGLMSLATGGGGTPTAYVLLVDQDDTFLSNFISGAQGQGQLGDFLEIEKVELAEGMERIEAGDATGLLVLPEGFTEALFEEEPTTLTLVTNPSQSILPAMLQEGLEMFVEASFYLQRILGEPLREMSEGPPDGSDFFTDRKIAALSADINRRMRRLEDVLFPVVLKLETEVAEEGEEEFNFGLFFVPGVLFMALLFIAQGMSEDLWQEKEQGTLRRILSTPHSVTVFLVGKLAAGGLLMAAVTLLGLGIDVLAYDVPLAVVPSALLWCTFSGTALLTLFFLLQFFTSTRRAGSILTSVVLFPLMMIGGSFFPFEAMPSWMVDVGSWTPNGLGVLRLKDILRQQVEPGSLLLAVAVIGGLAVLALLASDRLLRRRFAVS